MLESASPCLSPLDPTPFEAFHEGSWHGAELITIENGDMWVRITPTSLLNIQTDFLRMRSRKATPIDCSNFLRPGIDVCALLPPPPSLNSDPQPFMWIDARIIKIKRSHHVGACNCLFALVPYKCSSLIHRRNLVSDPASTILVRINQISILQNPHQELDENGNIILSSTENETSVYKAKLFNFMRQQMANLRAFSILYGAIGVKAVQAKIIYHVREDDVSQDGSLVIIKVVNFMNSDGDGIIKHAVDKLCIEHTEEITSALTAGSETSVCIPALNADMVYESVNIRRPMRQNSFESYAQSAIAPFSSNEQQKKEPEREEVTVKRKHAAKPRKNYRRCKEHGAKRKEYDDLIEDQGMRKEAGYYPLVFEWPPPISEDEREKEKRKDEYEDLWKEMDYCLDTLALLEQKKNLDCGDEAAIGEDKEESCIHDCVLDEQVGLICKHCNVVCTEIRYILPPMMKERSCQMPKGRVIATCDTFEINPSFLETPTSNNTSQPKSTKNIWAPILHIKLKLHPHQKKAFEFIWKNLTGSLEPEQMSSTNSNTGGCVISHSPGSGKTLTAISFLISYMAVFRQSHPLVLTPKSVVHTWERELEKWGINVPVHTIHQDIACQNSTFVKKTKGYLDSHSRRSCKSVRIRDSLEKVRKWHENPGVLLMTYSSFLSLAKEGSRNGYREFMANVLQNSPGLLVLDEGHNPRSTSSKLRRLLMKVKTESRILLSGTVFQNNFKEYFNTLCLARPRFVRDVISELKPKNEAGSSKRGRKAKGEEKEAQILFVEKIGQKIESDNISDITQGFDVLNKLTSGFINVFDGEKLQNLPGIEIYTIFLQCTDPQEKVLQTLQKINPGSRYPLEIEFLVSVGAIHPCLVGTSNSAKGFFTENELKEMGSNKSFSRGSKTSFVIDVILKSRMSAEKVLVFCHNLEPLKLLIEQIESRFGWREGEEILFLHGDQELSVRSCIIDKFNGDINGKGKMLLASTNACAEGISLTAASRVVLLDSEWNPSKTKQAIARAYRPGQEKVVHVYLLSAAGSWEESKYESNKRKARMSKMVLSGKYLENSSTEPVTAADITDEMLREIVEEDKGKTVKMVVKNLVNDEV